MLIVKLTKSNIGDGYDLRIQTTGTGMVLINEHNISREQAKTILICFGEEVPQSLRTG